MNRWGREFRGLSHLFGGLGGFAKFSVAALRLSPYFALVLQVFDCRSLHLR